MGGIWVAHAVLEAVQKRDGEVRYGARRQKTTSEDFLYLIRAGLVPTIHG